MTVDIGLPQSWYFFGSLLDAGVRESVVGRAVPDDACVKAVLDGYKRVRVAEESYPALVACPGSSVDGILVTGLSAEETFRVMWFEGDEYAPEQVNLRLPTGEITQAHTFLAAPDLPLTSEAWHYERWARAELAHYLPMTREWMSGYGEHDFAEQDAIWRAAQDPLLQAKS
ncbi:MAG: gamma-glutamylcyclotransferase family protein [Pseudomonadota bacterium]